MTEGISEPTEMEAALTRVEEDPDGENYSTYEYREYKLDPRGQQVIGEDGEPILLASHDFRAENPTEGQLTFLMASMGRGMSSASRVAAVVNFLDAVLDPESADYLNMRLLQRENPFPPEGIEKIFRHFTEAWFGRPTK